MKKVMEPLLALQALELGPGREQPENAAEIASPKKVDEFSKPQADQKEENRERFG